MKQGFTLIEMLVVVLIMAILAAIALPHYQLAIDKARYTEAIAYFDAIKNAEEMYYLMHRKYTTDLGELDIKFPYTPTTINGRFKLGGSGNCYVELYNVDTVHGTSAGSSDGTSAGNMSVWCNKIVEKKKGRLGHDIRIAVFSYMDHATKKGTPFDEKWYQRFCMPIISAPENVTPRVERLCKSFGTQRMGAGGTGTFPSSPLFVGWPIPQ